MATIFIEQLAVSTTIGVLAWEKQIKQTVLLDLEFEYDIHRASESDQLEHTVDYSAIAETIIHFGENAKFQLLEALGQAIIEKITHLFSISWIRLRLTKPYAVDKAKAVGIVIEHGARA